MRPLGTILLFTCVALSLGHGPRAQGSRNSLNNSQRPTEWLPTRELEALPAVDELNLKQLEGMTNQEGAELVNKIYHLSQISRDGVQPEFAPNAEDIPVTIVKTNGQNVETNLKSMVSAVKQQDNFGNQEVTILITGLPKQNPIVGRAVNRLIEAYKQRYNRRQQQQQQQQQGQKDEDYDYSTDESRNSQDYQSGSMLVIDLGTLLNTFQRYATLDVDRTGSMIGNTLVQLTNEVNVPQEIIHIVAQGIAAHVAGAAGRQYTRLTGHKLRRITALDPSKIIARNPNTLVGLARGHAAFVDAIHTSAYGMGIPTRVGDADFYPNGPSVAMPGTDNIVESSMRATRYYAETVRPGNERNFPAVPADSLQQYKNNNGHGRRAYMGIDADFDLKGDYMLQVNNKAPYGRNAPAKTQNNYHNMHKEWRNNAQN